MNLGQRLIIALIERYQRRGGGTQQYGVSCNFTPTCSEYARQAIARYGVWHGGKLAYQRLRRCNVPDQVGQHHDPLP